MMTSRYDLLLAVALLSVAAMCSGYRPGKFVYPLRYSGTRAPYAGALVRQSGRRTFSSRSGSIARTSSSMMSFRSSQSSSFHSARTSTRTSEDVWTNFKDTCRHGKMDVVFVLDGSRSVLRHNFQTILRVVSDMVGALDVGFNRTRVGVMQYSSCIKPHVFLRDYFTVGQVQSAIARIRYEGRGAATGRAIQFTATRMFHAKRGARAMAEGIRRIFVFITDGKWSSAQDLSHALALLDALNVERFAIGIGRASHNVDLDRIASHRTETHVQYLDSFEQLPAAGKTILRAICADNSCNNANTKEDNLSGCDILKAAARSGSMRNLPSVQGSKTGKKAFSLGPRTTVQLAEASQLFPHQLPLSFAIASVFRMGVYTRSMNWCLFEVRQPSGSALLSVKILAADAAKRIQLEMTDDCGAKKVYEFRGISRIFDFSFHKLVLYVSSTHVTLTVDCVLIGQLSVQSRPTLARVDGPIVIAKELQEDYTVAVDIQSLVVWCNATYDERRRPTQFDCCELPGKCPEHRLRVETGADRRVFHNSSTYLNILAKTPIRESQVVRSNPALGTERSQRLVLLSPTTQLKRVDEKVTKNAQYVAAIRLAPNNLTEFDTKETKIVAEVRYNVTTVRLSSDNRTEIDADVAGKITKTRYNVTTIRQADDSMTEIEDGVIGKVAQNRYKVTSIRRVSDNATELDVNATTNWRKPKGYKRRTPHLTSTTTAPSFAPFVESTTDLNNLSSRDVVLEVTTKAPKVSPDVDLSPTRSSMKLKCARLPGPPGPYGYRGPKGHHGATGLTGVPGQPGTQGPRGPPGFPGPRGIQGERGLPGPNGYDGQPGEYGAPGDIGRPGLPGERGMQGPRGWTGSLGPVGLPGTQGVKGDKGNKGRSGLDGTPGPAGIRGRIGSRGKPGPKGQTGALGSPGFRGPKGHAGMFGFPGPKGHRGSNGAQGVAGSPGAPGKRGESGENGLMGIRGRPGLPGKAGYKGEAGVRGVIGPRGNQGAPGQKGSAGLSGQPGKPGYYGFPGPKGHRGKFGQTGKRGETGKRGPVGKRGQKGIPGSRGEPGPVGDKGEVGAPGPRGVPGLNGPVGPKGDKGSSGSPGAAGIIGPAGPRGPSGPPRDMKEIEALVRKTLAEMLPAHVTAVRHQCQRCIPPKLSQGKPGPPGDRGGQGPPGPQGQQGIPGLNGPMGLQGRIGATGPQGLRGEKGDIGAPGHSVVGTQGPPGPSGKPGIRGRVYRGKDGRKGQQGIIGARGLRGRAGPQGQQGHCKPADCGAAAFHMAFRSGMTYYPDDTKGPPARGYGYTKSEDDTRPAPLSSPEWNAAQVPEHTYRNAVGPRVLEQLKGPNGRASVNLRDTSSFSGSERRSSGRKR